MLTLGLDLLTGLQGQALVAECAQFLKSTLQNLMASLPQRVESVITTNRGLNLERDFQKAHVGVIVRCPQTFDHLVYNILCLMKTYLGNWFSLNRLTL